LCRKKYKVIIWLICSLLNHCQYHHKNNAITGLFGLAILFITEPLSIPPDGLGHQNLYLALALLLITSYSTVKTHTKLGSLEAVPVLGLAVLLINNHCLYPNKAWVIIGYIWLWLFCLILTTVNTTSKFFFFFFFFGAPCSYHTVFSSAAVVSGTLHPAVWDMHISS
jgi:hypothetical protein